MEMAQVVSRDDSELQELIHEISERDFGIYSSYAGKRSACGYYRIEVPLRGIYDLKLGSSFIDRGAGNREEAYACMLSADIMLSFAPGSQEILHTIETIRRMKPGLGEDKKTVVFPPSLIFDIDDNLDWVHPFNRAFRQLGTRSVNGQLLEPGDVITTVMPDGQEQIVWKDNETVIEGVRFSVKENRQRISMIHEAATRMDGVTVPSKYLANYYREKHGCTDVYVFPNSIIFRDYPQPRLMPHEGVRILWQGGGSHMQDWWPLRDVVREVALKYPQAKFLMWGAAYKYIHDNIPEAQVEFLDWVDYEAYKPMRMIVDADINLCPLVDNEFNRSKSAIKWYESALPYRPEATLAANVPPYSDEIEDGVTGLLYSDPKEFGEKLGILIERADLRQQYGEASREWVKANRDYLKTVPDLYNFYCMLRARKRFALAA